jgi:hypothetical protein
MMMRKGVPFSVNDDSDRPGVLPLYCCRQHLLLHKFKHCRGLDRLSHHRLRPPSLSGEISVSPCNTARSSWTCSCPASQSQAQLNYSGFYLALLIGEFTLGSSLLTILLPVKLALLQPPSALRLRPTSVCVCVNYETERTLGPGAEHRVVDSEFEDRIWRTCLAAKQYRS